MKSKIRGCAADKFYYCQCCIVIVASWCYVKSFEFYIYISDHTLRLSQGSLFWQGTARPPPPCLLGVPPNSRCVGACSEMAQCKKRCGRRANVPRFGTCCGACPTRHTRECGVRHPAACTHQCGRRANRPRFISCCGRCPDRHTRQCGFRQGLPGVVLETSTGTLAVESRGRFSAPEPEDDIALCWMCRCEIPTDEVFWCLNRGCDYAFYGVCFECLTGHACRFAPVDLQAESGEPQVWCVLHEQWRPLSSCKRRGSALEGLGRTPTYECYGAKRCRPAVRAEETGNLREPKKARAELGKETAGPTVIGKEAKGGGQPPEG